MRLRIAEPGGVRVVELDGPARIGRAPGNDVVLRDARVSSRHLELRPCAEGLRVRDLGSRNGTLLEGRRLEDEALLEPGATLRIGDVTVQLLCDGERTGPPPPPRESPPAPGLIAGDEPASDELRRAIHAALLERLDLRRLDLDAIGPEELRRRAAEAVRAIVAARDDVGAADRAALERDVLDEALGLGPLEALLADDSVSEILVNRPDRIYVERAGRLELSGRRFSSERAVLQVIDRIVAPLGRRIDEASPMVDARLPDGSRVNAIVPPLALQGPCLTIRKFRRDPLGIEELVRLGTASWAMARFLEVCVRTRRNVVISGGTGSGKTTLLNVLTGFVPEEERIVTVEDAAELKVRQPHWVQLEARPANLEGRGAVGIRELVRNCLRMRPDRIVVGECRGGEALDMLQAMNTGHDGSLTTVHANGPRDALARLETLCLMSGVELPARAIREQIARAVDVIVQQVRFPDGTRRITHVTEVTGMESDVISLQDVFHFEVRGYDPAGRVIGRHQATGLVPRFVEELRRSGREIDPALFTEEE